MENHGQESNRELMRTLGRSRMEEDVMGGDD